jgi:putative hydrolase of the HAD superfamily
MARWVEGVRAVTLDVGGTLLKPWPSVGHVYAAVAAEFGMKGMGPEQLNEQFKRAWSSCSKFDYTRGAWQEVVNQTFAGLVAAAPSSACFDAIYECFARPESWRLFEDVLPTLAALRARGLRLGVISNWDERLRPLLDRLQLSSWFEVMVVSHDVKCTKPDPEIFARAAAQFGLPPAALLHVGDGEREDVAGARGAGFAAVHLQRGGELGLGRIAGLLELVGD